MRKLGLPQPGPKHDRDVVVPPAVLERLRLERRAAEQRKRSLEGSILQEVGADG
jgi:hypothetical protein